MDTCHTSKLYRRVKLELFGVRGANSLGRRLENRIVTQCIRFSVTAKPHKSTGDAKVRRELLNLPVKIASLIKKREVENRSADGNISNYLSKNIAAVIRDNCLLYTSDAADE